MNWISIFKIHIWRDRNFCHKVLSITLQFFLVDECESFEVTQLNSEYTWRMYHINATDTNGFYVRTDDRASAPTKKSIWKLSNKTYFIYYARSAKAWRLGHRTHLITDNYYYSGKY